MAKKEKPVSERTLQQVRRMIDVLSVPLHLTGWTFVVRAGDNPDNPAQVMVIYPQDEYMQALVEVQPFYGELDAADRLETVAHELIHAVLSPLLRSNTAAATKECERVTSHVTAIFMGQYRRRRKAKTP